MVRFIDFDEAMRLELEATKRKYDVDRVQRDAQQKYDAAPRCPVCGDKRGFSMGTGDCGCEED